MRRTPQILLLFALMVSAGCARYYFDGEVAILDSSPVVVVAQRSSDWGDCYRRFGSVPVVYKIERPDYVLDIVHGQRYWAELFFLARSHSGVELVVVGPNVTPVRYRSGGDMRRLSESRGVLPGYETARLDASSHSLTLTIADEAGKALGVETLSFKVEVVSCLEIDSI